MLKDPAARRGLAVFAIALIILSIDLLFGFGQARASEPLLDMLEHAGDRPAPPKLIRTEYLPPRFVPGTFLYVDNKLVKILLGTTMFLNLKECMEDVQASVQRALPSESRKVTGFCLPVPTLDVSDLTPPVETERGSL